MSMYDKLGALFLGWRKIDPDCVCTACGGSGSGETVDSPPWSNVEVTKVVTCEVCWGTGDLSRPGANLNAIETLLNSKNDEIDSLRAKNSDMGWELNTERMGR